ncbi:hypothetical protein [Plantactinospora sonchi]|uniref:Uncharacterized protein n=1 Tax=Plantactinospora sonchi TaxID=1544735 RepID=A0ABU7RL65_9ACTN
MSISLLLIPLAVAAATAATGLASGQDEDGQVVCQVQTRMRDENLLSVALRETGALVTADNGQLNATWDGVHAAFRRGTDGIWAAHFTGDVDERRAVEIVHALDAGYGRQVQRAVLDRLHERAPAAGLRLESESATEDNAVRLVFTVAGRERSA